MLVVASVSFMMEMTVRNCNKSPFLTSLTASARISSSAMVIDSSEVFGEAVLELLHGLHSLRGLW